MTKLELLNFLNNPSIPNDMKIYVYKDDNIKNMLEISCENIYRISDDVYGFDCLTISQEESIMNRGVSLGKAIIID